MQEWNGDNRRSADRERDRLLTQIDTKLTILLENFDKHILDDKEKFGEQEKRIKNLERIMWLGMGGLAVFQVGIRFLLK